MFLRAVLAVFILISVPTYAADKTIIDDAIIVKHYQQQERYAYGARVLELALSKLGQPFLIRAPREQIMNEARGELQVIEGRLDLQWMITTEDRESKMIPVKVPLYQGILGTRLLLAKHDRLDELKAIKSLADLQGYVGGHGTHWKDLSIYGANDLKVSPHVNYESLFQMLSLGRFDYFHRGLNEIWGEAERYADTLSIVDEVMLFYSIPVYFFVSPHRPELAKQLEEGLRLAIEDGSLKALFLEFNGEFIEQGKLIDRNMIVLKNPDLPTDTPALDTSWWLPDKFQEQLTAAGY